MSEVEREIVMAKKEQEERQKDIDQFKQLLQNTSQAQDKGRTHDWHQSCSKPYILQMIRVMHD